MVFFTSKSNVEKWEIKYNKNDILIAIPNDSVSDKIKKD